MNTPNGCSSDAGVRVKYRELEMRCPKAELMKINA
jgi:hypothetical protein